MRSIPVLLIPVLFLMAATLLAGVDGTVINRTTGKPQPGASLLLMAVGQGGPKAAGVARAEAQGKFRIDTAAQGPQVLQTTYRGVTYSQMLTTGSPASNIEVEVYEPSNKPGTAPVLQHMVLLEPAGPQLAVSETVILRNQTKLTYYDPANGTFRFALPAATQGKVRVMATAPGGMPVERPAAKTGQADVYKIDFPMKPGETSIELTYTMPLESPAKFAGRLLHREGLTRLVVPAGVALAGEDLERLGQEPRTQATIYGIKGNAYQVEIQGTAAARVAQPPEEEDSGPTLDQIAPPGYEDRRWVVLGLAAAVLLLGFLLHYRRRLKS